MRSDLSWIAAALSACAASIAVAQPPVSAQPPVGAPSTAPPVLTPRPVEQTALARDAFSTGLLAPDDGALSGELWRGANAQTLAYLLELAPARPASASLGEALRRVLLSSGEGPADPSGRLGGRKLLALVRAGFVDEARAVASLSNAPRNDPAVGQALALSDLLDGRLDEACRRNAALTSGRDAPFWVKLRVLCYAANGERDAADLTFGLLREQGALDDVDESLLTAVVTGAQLKTPAAPVNAFHLAAIRALKLPLAAPLLDQAEGAVLATIAKDGSYDAPTRVGAVQRAAAMGVAPAAAIIALYDSLPADIADIARAGELAASRRNDPMTDILIYKLIRQMSAPEFLRDKAGRIADAVRAADSFARLRAAALVYDGDIVGLEGALLPPGELSAFALARLALGDGAGAGRWLGAMISTGGVGALGEGDAAAFIDLLGYLQLLDPALADAIGDRAGVTVEDPFERAPGKVATSAPALPAVLEAAFDAALNGARGQAGLAALAASSVADEMDELSRVLIGQSLRVAGLDDLRARMTLEAALKARLSAGRSTAAPRADGARPADATPSPPPRAPAAEPAPPPSNSSPASPTPSPTPRLKPRRRG